MFKCATENSSAPKPYKSRCAVQCPSCKHLWGEAEVQTDATDKTLSNGASMVPASRRTGPRDDGWTYFRLAMVKVPRGQLNELTNLLAEINCPT